MIQPGTAALLGAIRNRNQKRKRKFAHAFGWTGEYLETAQQAMPRLQPSQSAGGFSISQKLPPGLSNSRPTSQDASLTTEIRSTIFAVLLRPFEISFSDTGVLFLSCTGRMIPHPCAFTTTVWYFPEKLCSRSRLVIITGICRETLVLRRTFLNPSRAIPSLGLNVGRSLPMSILETQLKK